MTTRLVLLSYSSEQVNAIYLYSSRQKSDGLLQVNNDLVSKVRYPEHRGILGQIRGYRNDGNGRLFSQLWSPGKLK